MVGRQTTVIMPRVENSEVLDSREAYEGTVKVVKHRDDEIVRVYHSTQTHEVAEFGYHSDKLDEEQAGKLAQEYANGYIVGLER